MFASSLLSTLAAPFCVMYFQRSSLQTCVTVNYLVSASVNFVFMVFEPGLALFSVYCSVMKVG